MTAEKGALQVRVDFPPFVLGQAGGIGTWLRQVDIRLELSGIKAEELKYKYVAAALPPEITARVYDLINKPPENDQYTTLINRIREEFEPSESEQVVKLLKGLRRGDKKPSLFLREMRELAGVQVGDTLLRELFLAELPSAIADILTIVETKDLESLAKAADKGWERDNQARTSLVAPVGSQDPTDARIDAILSRLEKVSEAFAKIPHTVNSGESRGRSRNRSATPGPRGRKHSRSRQRNPKWTKCWYHFKFGDKATKCEEWCEEWSKRYKPSEN